MRKMTQSFAYASLFLLMSIFSLQAEQPLPPTNSPQANRKARAFEAFTGKITKNKVRMRLQPAYDAQVLKELNKDDLILILDENDDFFAVQPPAGMKAYVFRTYILDNVVEGSHVNVRLKPDLDAPVVAQLNSGDIVDGKISPANSKWIEMSMPNSTRFYVSKEYVQKMGDAGLLTRLETKREEGERLFAATLAANKEEMQKPFDQIHLDAIVVNYQNLSTNYSDFPDLTERAKTALKNLQEAYTSKKLAYLEAQTKDSTQLMETKNKLAQELKEQQTKISLLEQQIQRDRKRGDITAEVNGESDSKVPQYPHNMSSWFPVEDALFATWSKQTNNHQLDAFYREQREKGIAIKGVIEPYNRPVKNKPGDYMLVNATSKLPIAFLYSTLVNLQDYVGHEVSLLVTPRSNNHYAFPAYFVLTIE